MRNYNQESSTHRLQGERAPPPEELAQLKMKTMMCMAPRLTSFFSDVLKSRNGQQWGPVGPHPQYDQKKHQLPAHQCWLGKLPYRKLGLQKSSVLLDTATPSLSVPTRPLLPPYAELNLRPFSLLDQGRRILSQNHTQMSGHGP